MDFTNTLNNYKEENILEIHLKNRKKFLYINKQTHINIPFYVFNVFVLNLHKSYFDEISTIDEQNEFLTFKNVIYHKDLTTYNKYPIEIFLINNHEQKDITIKKNQIECIKVVPNFSFKYKKEKYLFISN